MAMDYLDFRDILYLCQDPEFPVSSLLRRHLIAERSSYSILQEVIDDDWSIISAIKVFMQILGTWNVPGPSGILPLNEAIVYERADLCRLFIEAEARVNSLVPTEPHEPSPTLFRRRGMDEIDHLIHYEANFYWAPNDPDFEPLHLAAIVDNLDLVDLLLEHGANPNALVGSYGSPLHLTKDYKIAQSLISKGANINALNGAGSPPLFMAIARRRESFARQLLDAGADVNMYNKDKVSALALTCKIGYPNFIYQLISAGCDVQGPPSNPSLHIAVLNRNQGIAQFLLDRGANVNQQNEYGTALHVTKCGEMAEILLAYGADVDAQDADGDTPLMLNIIRRNHEMFNVLLTAGADWKSPKIDWDDFIYDAVYSGKYTTVKLLLTHCKIKISKENYLNPIPCAIEHGHEGIARLLIENDPDLVNQPDDEGITPISAAMQWRPTLVAELLAAGAIPTDSDLDFDSDTDPGQDSNRDGLDSREDLRAAVAKALKDEDMDTVRALMDSWKKTYT
ncbi:hypothetical protein ZTR_11178 [Talaromyces verruculosus]|nr:hypothetical protein ZTR_11178 [Talaromyces verruculosus]